MNKPEKINSSWILSLSDQELRNLLLEIDSSRIFSGNYSSEDANKYINSSNREELNSLYASFLFENWDTENGSEEDQLSLNSLI